MIGDINARKLVNEGVIILPTVLYGTEAWGTRSVEVRNVIFS